MSESVSVFAEGTFEEQLQELLEYTARGYPDDERTPLLQSLQDAVKTESPPLDDDRRRIAFGLVLKNTKTIGHGTDQGADRGILQPSLLTSIHSLANRIAGNETASTLPDQRDLVFTLQHSLGQIPLSNLFNAAPRTSALRLPIYTTLFQIAAAKNELEVLALTKPDVQRWLKEWQVSDEEKSQFLKNIIDELTKAGKADSAYEYRILLIHIPPSSPAEARAAAVNTIAAALRIPTVFDFDALYNLDPIIAVRDHELFALLQIFLKNGLPEFRTWVDKHSATLESYQLDSSQLERKIRLVHFSSLASNYIGRDLPYSTIASTLQIDPSHVEKWTIDVIRAGLASGKLSQTTQQFRVYKSLARKFEREQWEALEKRLLSWKAGLASVIDVVALAQQRGGNVAGVVQGTQNDEQQSQQQQQQGIQVEGTA